MAFKVVQPADLSPNAFSNNNTANQGGITVRVDSASTVGSAIAAAIAGLPADVFVTGGTYDAANDKFTMTRSNGTTFDMGANGLLTDGRDVTVAYIKSAAGGIELSDNSGTVIGYLVK